MLSHCDNCHVVGQCQSQNRLEPQMRRGLFIEGLLKMNSWYCAMVNGHDLLSTYYIVAHSSSMVKLSFHMVPCFKAITAVSVYACVSVKENREDSPSRREDECVRPQMNISCCSFLLSALPTTLGRGRLSVCIGRGGFNCRSTTFDLYISRGL